LRLLAHDTQGDEALAREALSRRQQQVEVSTSLADQMNVQEQAINKLFNSMQQLEAKITEAKVSCCCAHFLPYPVHSHADGVGGYVSCRRRRIR